MSDDAIVSIVAPRSNNRYKKDMVVSPMLMVDIGFRKIVVVVEELDKIRLLLLLRVDKQQNNQFLAKLWLATDCSGVNLYNTR